MLAVMQMHPGVSSNLPAQKFFNKSKDSAWIGSEDDDVSVAKCRIRNLCSASDNDVPQILCRVHYRLVRAARPSGWARRTNRGDACGRRRISRSVGSRFASSASDAPLPCSPGKEAGSRSPCAAVAPGQRRSLSMAEITLADLLAWEPRLSLTGGDGLERPGALAGAAGVRRSTRREALGNRVGAGDHLGGDGQGVQPDAPTPARGRADYPAPARADRFRRLALAPAA